VVWTKYRPEKERLDPGTYKEGLVWANVHLHVQQCCNSVRPHNHTAPMTCAEIHHITLPDQDH